jgi:hypothetical protein
MSEKRSIAAVASLLLPVGGGDTAHGRPPRLVSPPTGDNLEYTQHMLSVNDILMAL